MEKSVDAIIREEIERVKEFSDIKINVSFEKVKSLIPAYVLGSSKVIFINKAIDEWCKNFRNVCDMLVKIIISHEYRHILQHNNLIILPYYKREDDAWRFTIRYTGLSPLAADCLVGAFMQYIKWVYYGDKEALRKTKDEIRLFVIHLWKK